MTHLPPGWELSGATPWLLLCALLMVGLGLHSLHYYLGALVFLFRRREPPPLERPDDPVTVLIPARDEGPCAVRALRSVLAQDHDGPVAIRLLVKDRDDTSLPFLRAEFPGAVEVPDEDALELQPGVRVQFLGVDPKAEKINRALASVSTPWTAILDCDHQAEPAWLRTSIALLLRRGERMIQARRAPLGAGGLFPLWDSLHQHVGCEVFNAAFDRLGLTVFFTGTTAVLETSLLVERPLRDCITEDVDLAYDFILDGGRIGANPHAGSAEEVSPDLYSFLARRRRWASGHTDAFLRHLPRLRRSPLGWRQRAQLLIHGVHYLVALAVFLLQLLIGLWFVPELPGPSVALAGAVGAGLSLGVVRSQRAAGWRGVLAEGLLAFLWFAPAVVIAMNLAVALLMADPGRASLPLPWGLQAMGLLGFVAPPVALLVGLGGFRQLTPSTAAAVLVTYPVAFYLDVCGVLLGLLDSARGGRLWRRVARPGERSGPVEQRRPRSIRESWQPARVLAVARRAIPGAMKPSRALPVLLLLGLFLAGVLYSPEERLAVEDAPCEALEQDGDPWIVPQDRLSGYCEAEHGARWSTRTGSFSVARRDDLAALDPSYWDTLDSTFSCNQARFRPDNVAFEPGAGARITLKAEAAGDRAFTSADLATKDTPEAHSLYGRYEVVLKAARGSGLLTAFFLYRFDPWQEIDAEFLGRDTTRMLINVYYNPGEEGDLYNYGFRGTPVLVDLGFDAADDFHTYAIEWDPGELRWFADGRLIHRRRAGQPTPIPHLPMRLHINLWPTCSEELAGALDPSALPATAEVRSVTISSWSPGRPSPLRAALDRILPARRASTDWRDRASWIQPGR